MSFYEINLRIRAVAVLSYILQQPAIMQADSEPSDQVARTRRLILAAHDSKNSFLKAVYKRC